jgi:hypothetical protein
MVTILTLVGAQCTVGVELSAYAKAGEVRYSPKCLEGEFPELRL